MATTGKMIKLNNICKKIDDRIILDDINLTINSGEMTFIVGTSGAGKTTLMNIIGGLDKASSGTAFFDDKLVSDDLTSYRAQNVGFIFQEYNLISGLSAIQNVELSNNISGISITTEEIISKFRSLGILNVDQKSQTLSGGEKQRVAIIRSICKDAQIIIADEPTGNLDSENAELVFKLLQSIKDKKHIIVVSHDMEKAHAYADRIITLSDGKIIGDEHLNSNIAENHHDEKCISQNKKTNVFKSISLIGKNSIRMRWRKMLSIAFVIALAIASLSIVFNLNNYGNNISHDLNVNYLEADLLNIVNTDPQQVGLRITPFSQESIDEIKRSIDIKESVDIYLLDEHNWSFSNGYQIVNARLKQINIDDFFNERIMSNNIEGNLITNKNEIILAEDIANALFNENCIGYSVSLNDGNGNSKDFSIVGINHTANSNDEFYSFLSSEALEDIRKAEIEQTIYDRQELVFSSMLTERVRTGGLRGTMQQVDNSKDLIYGSFPSNKNEILISNKLLSNTYKKFNLEGDYSVDDVLDGKISATDYEKIFSEEFLSEYNGKRTVFISGIYKSDENELMYSEDLINELSEVRPVGLDIYISNLNKLNAIKQDLSKNSGLSVSTQQDTLKKSVFQKTLYYSIALIALGVIFLLISIALLASFSKISVLERKKEIAILKSLGADNKSVLKMLLFDSVFISLLSLILALIINIIANQIFKKLLPDVSSIICIFSPLLIIFTCLVFSLLSCALIALYLKKVTRKMPADLLK